jgi:glycyl-tRNA synthetase
MADTTLMDKLVSLAKRRGFVFQSSEIYGGLGSVWDYGPLGVELKRNVKDRWWRAMVHARDDIEGLDAAILMHPKVWEASGHVSGFTDPLVDCKHLQVALPGRSSSPMRAARRSRASVRVSIPPATSPSPQLQPDVQDLHGTGRDIGEQSSTCAPRPRRASSSTSRTCSPRRVKLPFGIAQIGKAFRNEITPGNFIFRTREFEQMEIEFFVKPGTDEEWFERWRALRMGWHHALGLDPAKLRWHEHGEGELAHYAKAAYDIEYEFPFGWQEIEGVHNRTDFDLGRHQEFSGKKLEYFDQAANTRYLPYVVETSAGADRVTLTVMVDAYREEEVEGEVRVVMGFHPAIAPIKAAVLPLTKKDGLPEVALELYHDLRRTIPAFYDDGGAIGRRYRRQDEVGTPWCFTVDHDTLTDRTVTVRHRDSMAQERIALDQVVAWTAGQLAKAVG